MRIALMADTHLSARAPECVLNWHAARRTVERMAARLTVNLGDITLDGQTHPEELDFASQLVRQWPTPMLCVPGNHEVGDGSGEQSLDHGLLAAYVNAFGADHWAQRCGPWLLLGVNAQLLGSGSAQEQAQWHWLEEQVEIAGPRAPTVLFLHRPLLPPSLAEGRRKGRYVAGAARERLLNGVLRRALRLVVSGHTHQYLDLTHDGVRHLWMPSSAFILPDHMQGRIGEKVVGVGLLDLGDEEARFDLWCPEGLLRHEVSDLVAFRQSAVERSLVETR